eukprot:2334958-Pleurochrysis_carterae.AAC.1
MATKVHEVRCYAPLRVATDGDNRECVVVRHAAGYFVCPSHHGTDSVRSDSCQTTSLQAQRTLVSRGLLRRRSPRRPTEYDRPAV